MVSEQAAWTLARTLELHRFRDQLEPNINWNATHSESGRSRNDRGYCSSWNLPRTQAADYYIISAKGK